MTTTIPDGLTMSTHYRGRTEKWGGTMDAWLVRLRFEDRGVAFRYFMGLGLEGRAPDVEMVLESLCAEAAMLDDWDITYGSPIVYKQVEQQTARLRDLLGPIFESVVYPD
jgi:hypothetical protein